MPVIAPVGTGDWAPVLTAARRAAALAVVRDVAMRITDRDRIEAAVTAARQQTDYPMTVHWQPASVAQGDAGIAVVCAYLDRCLPGQGWDVVGHGFLASAAAFAERVPVGPSLYAGLAGIGFAARELSRGGTRYARLAAGLDAALVPQAHALLDEMQRAVGGVPVGLFDAISGFSGVGAHLLTRRGHPAVDGALERMAGAVVRLTAAPASAPPGWLTPVEHTVDELTAALYPDGHLNLGLAHGIPGPLAFAALAHAEGVRAPGLRDAIAAAARWLTENRADDEWGLNWPSTVGPRGVASEIPEPSRAAWCYGSPGVARALWLAGVALEDDGLTNLACEAMHAVHRRPVPERRIDSPTFCHGVAGLLQVTLRFAHDTGAPAFAAAAADLSDGLLAAYEPESLLGYRSLEPGGKAVDQAGLLDGAPGVAMVLLAAATDAEPTWDRLFLLS